MKFTLINAEQSFKYDSIVFDLRYRGEDNCTYAFKGSKAMNKAAVGSFGLIRPFMDSPYPNPYYKVKVPAATPRPWAYELFAAWLMSVLNAEDWHELQKPEVSIVMKKVVLANRDRDTDQYTIFKAPEGADIGIVYINKDTVKGVQQVEVSVTIPEVLTTGDFQVGSIIMRHDHDHNYKPAGDTRLGNVRVWLDAHNRVFSKAPEFLRMTLTEIEGCPLCTGPIMYSDSVVRFGKDGHKQAYHTACFEGATEKEVV